MPYYIVPKGGGGPEPEPARGEADTNPADGGARPDPAHPPAEGCTPDSTYAYATRAAAHAFVAECHCLKTHEVIYRQDDDEGYSWRRRERSRFESGEYLPVPWQDTGLGQTLRDHWCHLSVAIPGKVAYTPDIEHGHLDRQIRLTPGRYLERFGFTARYGKTRIDEWVQACRAGNFTVQFATTAEDCERVYRGKGYESTPGWSSCMGPDCHQSFDVHPARVYGAPGDLAVAYLGDIDAVRARCVVWPARKVYTRVYGDLVLKSLLVTMGYQSGDLDGAKIPAIPHPHRRGLYLMPYVDGASSGADKCKGFFTLYDVSETGEYSTRNTCGTTPAYDEDSDDENTYTCDHCGTEFYDDDERYCPACRDAYWICEVCDDTLWEEDVQHQVFRQARYESRPRVHVICASCLDGHGRFTCDHCEARENEWRYDIGEQKRRAETGDAETICEACVDARRMCEDCGELAYEDPCDCEHCAAKAAATRPADHPELPLEPATTNDGDEVSL